MANLKISWSLRWVAENLWLPKTQVVDKIVRKYLTEEARLLRDQLRSDHKFRNRTGSLKRAIRYRTSGKSLNAKVFVNDSEPVRGTQTKERPNIHSTVGEYADIVYDGADPHEIYPFRAKRLRFFSERLGMWVSTSMVNHPGFSDEPFEASRDTLHMFTEYENELADELIELVKNGGK